MKISNAKESSVEKIYLKAKKVLATPVINTCLLRPGIPCGGLTFSLEGSSNTTDHLVFRGLAWSRQL